MAACTFYKNALGEFTVSKRPGTIYQIEIYFAVFSHSYLLFSFMKVCNYSKSTRNLEPK